MRVHHLQHVPFEGLGSMEPVLKKRGHHLTHTHLYENQPLPAVSDIDRLIIMGGPMSIYDDKIYPWLSAEKKFIREVINSDKIVIGICLGAQLIADALGARVYKNKHREIGWFNVKITPEAKNTILSGVFPEQAEVFHWHGDTFDIPAGAIRIAESEACKNQGFIMNDRIVAFQFHLETTADSAKALIENCRNELDGSRFVQTEEELLSDIQRFDNINQMMSGVLDSLQINIS